MLNKVPKRLSKKIIIIFLLLILVPILVFLAKNNTTSTTSNIEVTEFPSPKIEEPFGKYAPPKIPKKDVYTIFMVGDSMTEAIGPHGGKLNEFVNELYKSTPGNQRIVIDNYAKGSTNLLGLKEAMRQKTPLENKEIDPLLSRDFDILLIESFGYNPLSQLGLQEGLKAQVKTLDELMKLLTSTHPNSVIIFVATIAPNKANYAEESVPGKTLTEREQMATERMEYIKNHMAYAKDHNIPLIDIYSKSLAPGEDGDLKYINPGDHIHPSFEGIDLISHEIANYIYDNEVLPH